MCILYQNNNLTITVYPYGENNDNNKINLRIFYTPWISQIDVFKMNTVYVKE
jgi:hypothetical protein